MSAAQHLKSVVTLGGAVDSSFKGMTSQVEKELGGATRQVKTLEREQKSLNKQIKKAKLAGADVSFLAKKYDQLGKEINEASREARGFEAASELRNNLKTTATYAAATAAGVAGVTGTVLALTSATNAATAEQAGLAKATSMTITQFNAWGGIAKQAGLEADSTSDLVEELSNKFGEFKSLGEQSSVSDVFGALGIEAAMMEGLTAAEQFEFVMRRLEQVGDTQQAASLADMLFGGEGNKIVTYIKNSGKGLDDLLDAQKAVNNLTQEGADGALKYNTAMNAVTTAMYSAWQDVAGVVGGKVAPVFDELAGTVSAFVRENRAEIVDFLQAAVEGSIAFAGGVFELAGAVNTVVQTFGGWETVAGAVAGIMAGKMVMGIASTVGTIRTMVTALGTAKTALLAVNAVAMANPIGLVAGAIGLFTAAIVANWESVKEIWEKVVNTGAQVAEFFGFGDDDEESGSKVQSSAYYGTNTQSSGYNPYSYGARAQAANDQSYAASGANITQTVGKIEIHQQPGQSAEEVARETKKALSDRQDAMFDLSMSE